MTWVLWGKARGKSQDDLIHYGQDDMLVELEFMARETRYRATRRHALGRGRRRQGATDLQLQVQGQGDFQPITGNSIRETQAKIEEITGMDYDTFINSAFLLQGRADEFTNKSPGERKEVLAKILGLGFYDRLESRAKEGGDKVRGAASVIEGDLERMRREIAGNDGYHSELGAVSSELDDVTGRLETSKQAVDALTILVEDLRRKRAELDETKRRIPTMEEDVAHLQTEMATRQSRIASYEAFIGETESIQAGLRQFQDARQRYEELNRSGRRFDDLARRKSELEKVVDRARATLEERIKELKNRVQGELRPRAEAADLIARRLGETRARIQDLAQQEQDLAASRARLQNVTVRAAQLESQVRQLKSEGQELRSKLTLAESSHQGAQCPLCGSELGPQGCQRLSESYTDQMEQKLQLYRQSESSLREVDEEKSKLDEELPGQEAALRRGREEAHAGVAVLERQLDESQKAATELDRATGELAQEEGRLEGKLFAEGEREQMEALEREIQALEYDRGAHQRLYDEMRALEPLDERHRQLQEAALNLPQEQEFLAQAQSMYERGRQTLSESRDKLREIEGQVSAPVEWEEKLAGAQTDYRGLKSRHEVLFRRQVELEGELKRLQSLEAEIGGKQRALSNLQGEQAVYQELVRAFGRRGVQAMLIETVLPRLEEEANALLGRMTDGRMHVKLETQQERRSGKGEPIETLQINIGDELGARSYELFSGGEAFRINLALRIALSKVLANRRGAPLPTLFIDEGFGTQDTAGQEKILDVITAIESDFEKIIVITHLDDLKEAFQARIQVQKDEAGSTFWIS